jgi:site-specific DNA-methyltransferase (cytosine-N4-specific)
MPKEFSDLLLHQAHPYPCKFPGALVKKYLPTNIVGGVVLDPYCGSGTTLLEAARLGYSTIGSDCNPIAILITKCKLTNLDHKDIKAIEVIIDSSKEIESKCARLKNTLPNFEGRDHWFTLQTQREISWILTQIASYPENSSIGIITKTALSAIINKISNQDSETRYARIDKDHKPGFCLTTFHKKLQKLIESIIDRGQLKNRFNHLHLVDIKQKLPISDNTVDLIITSPPYANTMDYYLYHKQRMNILGYKFRNVLDAEIGSRHEFSSKKASVDKWDEDYFLGISEMARTLKKGASAFVVIGDSQIAGKLISGAITTEKAAKRAGLNSLLLESVPMTGKSRSFSASFQRPNKFEHVMKLTKL